MGKKAKVGKGRKDKFYRLAKETGYRSRASFKLIQLNRKWEFLNQSRVLIDLCAAPGGWLQVAASLMPMSSVIIGVDRVPIRAIPKVQTIEADITTDACRQALKKQLNDWKADVVLNDGAPNVGQSWLQDAYTQSDLTLKALKLACDYLRPGGWFVSKLFRSRDYQSLMWVFNQLFRHVQATKPQASRNQSAEIFVVCKGFRAPNTIDSKLFDSRHVFSEISEIAADEDKSNLINPSKVKRNREGYDDDATLLYKGCGVGRYLAGDQSQATHILNTHHQITFNHDDNITSHRHTTLEVKECCKDIRVLNRKDLKMLLTYWKKMNDCKKEWSEGKGGKDEVGEVGKGGDDIEDEVDEMEDEEVDEDDEMEDEDDDEEVDEDDDKVGNEKADLNENDEGDESEGEEDDWEDIEGSEKKNEVDEVDEEDVEEDSEEDDNEEDEKGEKNEVDGDYEAIKKEIEQLEGEEMKDLKRKRKKIRKLKMKLQMRLAERMTLRSEDVHDMVEGDEALFSLSRIRSRQGLTDIEQGKVLDNNNDDDDNDDYDAPRKKRLKSIPKDRADRNDDDYDNNDDCGDDDVDDAVDSDGGGDDDDDSDDDVGDDDINDENPLLLDLSTGTKRDKLKRTTEQWFSKDVFQNLPSDKSSKEKGEEKVDDVINATHHNVEDNDDDDDSDDSDYDARRVLNNDDAERASLSSSSTTTMMKKKKREAPSREVRNNKRDGFEIVAAEDPVLDAEGLALGTVMIRSKRTQREMMEMGYHRYTFNDEGNLPAWFVDDERRHHKRQLPISKDLVEAYKRKLLEINARPIKKIAEARARKKRRVMKKLDKARKKAEAITDNSDMSGKEKTAHLRSLYKKAIGKKKREVTYVVAKKGAKGKNVRKPAGTKGKYKVVDRRLKKDKRGLPGQGGKKK